MLVQDTMNGLSRSASKQDIGVALELAGCEDDADSLLSKLW